MRMVRSPLMAVILLALGGLGVMAADLVDVPGSSTRYPSEVLAPVAGRSVKMRLTGVALRTKVIVNVYAIASYLQHDVKVGSAEELAAADCAKRLHLVMERTVDGKDLAEAFRAAIWLNHPEPAFTDEVTTLVQFMRGTSVRKGDHILLTHVPGIGLHCSMAGKADFLIKNVHFARAVWDIYLGKKNVGEHIKKGLVSRL
jgi:hypothetical protein